MGKEKQRFCNRPFNLRRIKSRQQLLARVIHSVADIEMVFVAAENDVIREAIAIGSLELRDIHGANGTIRKAAVDQSSVRVFVRVVHIIHGNIARAIMAEREDEGGVGKPVAQSRRQIRDVQRL